MGLNSLHAALLAHIPDDLAQLIARQDLRLNDFVRGFSDGFHRSKTKGQGFEFRDHRAYVAGDDLRKMDWRAAARRDHPVIRQHESLRQRSFCLMVDASAAMGYGAGHLQKWYLAKALLAAITLLVERQQDRLAYLSSQDQQIELSCAVPSALRSHMGHIVHQLANQQIGGRCNWTQLFESAYQSLRHPTLIFIVSDFLDPSNPNEAATDGDKRLRQQLRKLRDLGHTVVMLQILHQDELEFPWTKSATLNIHDLRDLRIQVEGPAPDLRRHYLEQVHRYLDSLADQAHNDGIFLHRFRSDQALAPAFARILSGLESREEARPPLSNNAP